MGQIAAISKKESDMWQNRKRTPKNRHKCHFFGVAGLPNSK